MTPPRDIIILIDTSGSMTSTANHKYARNAAKHIINQLTVSDTVAIFAYGDNVVQVYPHVGDGFSPITSASKGDAIGAVMDENVFQKLRPGSNPGLAVQTAFDTFEMGDAGGTTTGFVFVLCACFILFFLR